MKKIVLNVEALQVESFVAEQPEAKARGTVRGNGTGQQCNSYGCDTYYCSIGYETCADASCLETCGNPYQPLC